MKLSALLFTCLAQAAFGQPEPERKNVTTTSSSTTAKPAVSNSSIATPTSSKTLPVVCYYYGWASTRPGPGAFDIDNIQGDLCTHVNFAYAGVTLNTWVLKSEVPRYAQNDDLFKNFTAIKTKFPGLKTLLSVGGWQHENGVFSAMAQKLENRQKFVASVLEWMEKYGFDGLDVAWPFPGIPYRGGAPQDKENYALLVKELADALKPKGLLLTVVAPITEEHLEAGYDVPELVKNVDWINAQTYDLRGQWNGVTDVPTPLFKRPIDVFGQETINVKDGLQRLVNAGAPKAKLVMGIPFFGRGFALLDRDNHGLHAPVNTNVLPKPGPFLRSNEIYGYFEICLFLKANWTREFDNEGQCPYIYYRDQWIGYDDPESIKHKVNFLLEEGYGGVFVFNNDMDDFRGLCGETNALLKTIKNTLGAGKNDVPHTA